MKKRIDFHKIGGYAILVFASTTFILGGLYNHFCTEQIAVRERHLTAIHQAIAPPRKAELLRERRYSKQFSRTYSITYRCEEPREVLMNHYQAELKSQGYVLTQKSNELIARKDGIILTVYFEEKEYNIFIKFDDIFQKLSI